MTKVNYAILLTLDL